MARVSLVLQMVIRVLFIMQLVMGVLFWTNNALDLVQLHMWGGILLVAGLWIQAVLGARAGAPLGLVVGAVVWGLITIAFGMTQATILPGDLHIIVEIAHLLVGVIAVGMAESLAARVKRASASGDPRLAST